MDKALSWSEQAVDVSLGGFRNFRTLSTYANLLSLNENDDQAAAILTEAFSTNPSQRLLIFYGNQAQNLKRYDLAIAAYKELEKRFPEKVWDAKNGLAKANEGKNDFKSSINYLISARKYAPDSEARKELEERIEILHAKSK